MYNKIGIVVKPPRHSGDYQVKDYLIETLQILKDLDKEIVLGEIAATLVGKENGTNRDKVAAISDILIVIGGDGTFLSVATDSAMSQIPIIGFSFNPRPSR